jgi:hypothetical protein
MHQWGLFRAGAGSDHAGQNDHMVAGLTSASTGLGHGLAFKPRAGIGNDGDASSRAFNAETFEGILARASGPPKPRHQRPLRLPENIDHKRRTLIDRGQEIA